MRAHAQPAADDGCAIAALSLASTAPAPQVAKGEPLNKNEAAMRVWASLVGLLMAAAAAVSAGSSIAGGYQLEYRFKGCADGASPAELVKVGGVLYGAAYYGDAPNCGNPFGGFGAVFSFDPSTGSLKPLYDFSGGEDGGFPQGRLASANGLLYGATRAGGAGNHGVVFSLSPKTGVETVVHAFGGRIDGAEPSDGLTLSGGMIYGATSNGGVNGAGTLFSVNPATGGVKIVHSFSGIGDGAQPEGDMTAVSGKLYGTTSGGGATGKGVVFSFDPSTQVLSDIYTFKASGDGLLPNPGLVHRAGKLYGTTALGEGQTGCPAGCGTIYRVDLATGNEEILYAFPPSGMSGLRPNGGMTVVHGLLYGTAQYGGDMACGAGHAGCGAVFSFDPASRVEQVLYAFTGGRDERYPDAGLTSFGQRLFGTTSGVTNACGACGTIFSIAP